MAQRLNEVLGRPLRVLHIGNIANNAYHNARLLNRIGIESDVICHDYYHSMGCPEWEDADFDGGFGDHFRPDWSQVNLQGFQRPGWFAQGPRSICIAYLIARRRGWENRAKQLWRWLQYAGRLRRAPFFPRGEALLARELGAEIPPWWLKPADPNPVNPDSAQAPAPRTFWVKRSRDRLRKVALFLIPEMSEVPLRELRIRWLMRSWGRLARAAVFLRELIRVPQCFWAKMKIFSNTVEASLEALLNFPTQQPPLVLHGVLQRVWAMLGELYNRVARRLEGSPNISRQPPRASRTDDFGHDVLAAFRDEFPQRPPLYDSDLAAFKAVIGEWRELFQEYDVVLAYSTDPILPYLAAVPYLALEHGTLREIPYQDSVIGRLTALAYRRAAHVFVTNSDCLDSARWLAGERVNLVNHPYDDKHSASISGVEEWREALCLQLAADFMLFYPTSNDWVTGSGYADKANDVFLRAFARLRTAGYRIGMVCCEWGQNVEESRKLLASMGCASNVMWVEPMGIVKFERTAMACDIVADQFKLGAFGGVTFKALAAGVPVMTHLDSSLFSTQFPMPPVVNCQREDDISEALRELLTNPERLAAIGKQSRLWVDCYHNADSLLKLEIAQFARLKGIDLGVALLSPPAPTLEVALTLTPS